VNLRHYREVAAVQGLQHAEMPSIERGDRDGPVTVGEKDVECVGDTDRVVGIPLDDGQKFGKVSRVDGG
jgi:hypothetical protein